jgi:ankyrin repeat protein
MKVFNYFFFLIVFSVKVSAITGDLNRDGQVDFDDFFIFADNFGKKGPPDEIEGRTRTSEESRKELEELGIEYNEESFIEKIKKGDSRAVKLFLEAGMNPNLIYNGLLLWNEKMDNLTPLILASFRGYPSIVKILLDAGADIHARAEEGFHALIVGAFWGGEEVIQILLEEGINVNEKTDWEATALMAAAYTDNLSVVELLVNAGADINAITVDGGTALMIAIEGHSDEAIDLLIDLGADINATDDDGETVLMQVINENLSGTVSSLLFSNGKNVNARDSNGETALMKALEMTNWDYYYMIRSLIEAGANVNIRDNDGRTALRIWDENHSRIKQLLQNAGATF